MHGCCAKENTVLKLSSTVLLGTLLCAGTSLAHAQNGLDVYLGVSTSRVGASNNLIDPLNTGAFSPTNAMGGAFGKAGANFMITPKLGVGAETDFRFSQGTYSSNISYRPTFYDFNLVYLPAAHRLKRIVPELQAGVGGVNLKFYYPQGYCDSLAGCSSSNTYLESSNHFQVHLEAGLRIYATSHLFIRPQVDAHYVNNFFQYGSNWVPEYGASVGWSFGER